MKGIDPKWAMYLGLLVTIEQAIGHGTVSLTNLVPESWAPYITSWCNFLAFVGTAVMTYQAAVSAPLPGPAANTPISPAVKSIIILAILAGALAFPSGAQAQFKTPQQIAADLKRTVNPGGASSATSTLDDIATTLAKPFQDIANFIGDDATGAISLATVIPALQDGHGQQCWMAMKQFGDVIKAHPVPITFHVIQDYETLRLLGMATNNLCSNVHCTQVFADATAMAQAASPMTLAIPSLHDLCTKVPQIAVVAPVTVATPTPAPSPTPDTK